MCHTLMTYRYIVANRGGEVRHLRHPWGEDWGEVVTLEPCVRIYARGSGSHYHIGKTNRSVRGTKNILNQNK